MKVKTTLTKQSRLVECRFCKAYKGIYQVFNFFIAFLNFGRFSSDLILFGISFQTFGVKYDKDPVPQYTVLTDLVVKVRLLLIPQLEDVLRGKTSFMKILGHTVCH